VEHGLRLAAAGVLAGVAGALALGRVLEGLLYGVTPRDPVTLALTAGGLIVVAAVACWIPARRAAAIDPVASLRAD
jgi:ABC-type antimicrobial peptide transport system permease subunit